MSNTTQIISHIFFQFSRLILKELKYAVTILHSHKTYKGPNGGGRCWLDFLHFSGQTFTAQRAASINRLHCLHLTGGFKSLSKIKSRHISSCFIVNYFSEIQIIKNRKINHLNNDHQKVTLKSKTLGVKVTIDILSQLKSQQTQAHL